MQPPIQPPYYPPPPQPPRSGPPVWVWVLVGCGCLGLAFPILLAAILFPVFSQARLAAQSASCLSNTKQMALAMIMYTQDYDDKLPSTVNWMDKIDPYLVASKSMLHCPTVWGNDSTVYGYAYNSALSGRALTEISQPKTTVMLYDSTNLARSASDTESSLPNPGRHRGRNSTAYADGHAKLVPPGMESLNAASP